MSDTAALGLARLAQILGRDLQRVARAVGGPDRLWRLDPDRLVRVLKVDGARASQVREHRRRFDALTARRDLAQQGISFVARAELPDRLREIYDPPFGLFSRGGPALDLLHARPVVALVGSRRPGEAARAFAHQLARDLTDRGAVVVSGLAQGIDAAAHRGALAAGGPTVAVLGCGVDVSYPRRNAELARQIREDGCLLSEYWPGTRPAPWRFPARNRLVAGLADAVIVLEAGARSGALITADFCLENGRPLLAVPQAPWNDLAAGGNALLAAGAALCQSAEDVVLELSHMVWRAPRAAAAGPSPSGPAERVAEKLRREAMDLDTLIGRTGLGAPEVRAALVEWELRGELVRESGGRYSLLSAPRSQRKTG